MGEPLRVDTLKGRDPRSPEQAVLRVVERLGWDGAAAAAGRSASLVHKWTDADTDRRISVEQALLLDQAFARACPGETPPFLALFEGRTGHAQVCDHAGAPTPAEAVIGATAELGALADRLRQALAPDSPGGRGLSVCEHTALQQALDVLRRSLHAVEDAIDAAGPPAKEGR
jgi:hypothetical protein